MCEKDRLWDRLSVVSSFDWFSKKKTGPIFSGCPELLLFEKTNRKLLAGSKNWKNFCLFTDSKENEQIFHGSFNLFLKKKSKKTYASNI